MPPKAKVPAIRFKGFADDWEERKLGNIVERIVRKNTNNESTLPLTISAQYGLVDQITYFNNRVASRDVRNYYLVFNGEFAYNKSTSEGFPFGTVKRLDLYENGVLSTLYIVFSIRDYEKTNSDFLAVFFNTDRWHKGVSERAAEGARNHGLLNISADDFLDIGLFIPRESAEQTQIGTYFKNLDNLITLHQRKLLKIKNLKKAMLEKMFPKNGSNVPEVRFTGFTDAWEQRKLGDIIVKLTGGASITPDTYQEKGVRTIPKSAVNSTGVADLYGSKNVNRQFFERNISSIVSANNLVTSLRDLVPSAPNMGRIVRIVGEKEDFLMPQGVYKIELDDRTDENFVIAYSNSERYRKIISSEKNGSTQVHIRNGEFLNIDIPTPSYEEQTRCGIFFKNLDNLITLHQRKYEKLQNIKKACLEKMFV